MGVHMSWKGYTNVMDVDILPGNSTDIYGETMTSGDGSVLWTKNEHCFFQFYKSFANFDMYDASTPEGISDCKEFCAEKSQCTALQITPLHMPPHVTTGTGNKYWGDHLKTIDLQLRPKPETVAAHGLHRAFDGLTIGQAKHVSQEMLDDPNRMICRLQVMISEQSLQNAGPDYFILDDPEDIGFYGTCMTKINNRLYNGVPYVNATEAENAKGSVKQKFNVGDYCLSCEDIDDFKDKTASEIMHWKLTTNCTKCEHN